jgi:hypothetical protein
MVDLGMAKIESLNNMVLEVINEQARDGWEPLYPFSMPSIWFRREVPVKRKTTTRKKRETS